MLAVRAEQEKLASIAANTARGIEHIGGVTKLTDGQLKSLNRTITEGVDAFRVLGKGVPVELQRVADAVAGQKKAITDAATPPAGGFFGDLAGEVTRIAAGFITAQAVINGVQKAFRTLTTFVKDSVQAYSEAEAAQQRLLAALRAQGTAVPAVVNEYNALATQFQRTTTFSDDLINEMQGLLVQVGKVLPSQMEEALRASTNLSAGLGIELRDATLLVAKAFGSGGDELGRLKAVLGDAAPASEEMADVLAAINAQFGGQATAQISTYAGRIQQITNDWNNFQEVVGETLVTSPLVVAALRSISDAFTKIGENSSTSSRSISNFLANIGLGPIAQSVALLEAIATSSNKAAEAQKRLAEFAALNKPMASHQTEAALAVAELEKRLKAQAEAAELLKKAHEKAKEAAKKLAEAMDDIRRAAVPLTASQQTLVRTWHDMGLAVGVMADAMQVSHTAVGEFVKSIEARYKQFEESLQRSTKNVQDQRDAVAKGLVPWLNQLRLQYQDVTVASTKFGNSLPAFLSEGGPGPMLGVVEVTEDWREALDGVTQAMGAVGDKWSTVAQGILRQTQAIVTLWTGKDAKGNAIKGGSNRWAAVGLAAGVAAEFVPEDTKKGAIAKGALQGASAGAPFAGFTGGASIAVGAGIGALAGWIKSQKAHKQVNDLRDSFVALAGGLGPLNDQAHKAGTTLTAMLDATTPAEYEAAIASLTDSLNFQNEAMQFLEDTMAKYGLTVQDMGANFQQQNLDEQAANLVLEFRALEAAGANVEIISQRMGDAMNAYVRDAIAAGTTVPAEMREIINQLIVQGLLLDENGVAFENIEDTGLTFAQTLTGELSSLTAEIKKLIEAITRGLGGAIANVPALTIPVNWGDPGPFPTPDIPGAATGGLVTAHGIQRFAGGGRVLPFLRRGSDSVPAMLTPGEIVLNASQQESVGDALGGGTVLDMTGLLAELKAVRASQERIERYQNTRFAKDLARANRDEVQKVSSRRR